MQHASGSSQQQSLVEQEVITTAVDAHSMHDEKKVSSDHADEISITLVSASNAHVIVEDVAVDPSFTVEHAKLQIAATTQAPVVEQVFSLHGRPLCNSEVLSEVAEGETRLKIVVRTTDSLWVAILEEVGNSRAGFEHHHGKLLEHLHLSLTLNTQRNASLKELVAQMTETYQSTLLKISDASNALLVASGELQRNREAVLDAMPRHSKGARQAAEELKSCREKVLASVQANGVALEALSSKLVPSRNAVLTGLEQNRAALRRAQEVLQREGELLHLAKARGWLFADKASEMEIRYESWLAKLLAENKVIESVAKEVRQCQESYRSAITVNGGTIRHILTILKRDQEVVFSWAFDHVSESRKCDRDFMLAIIQNNGEALERAPPHFKGDHDIVNKAIENSNGWALQFASDELRSDKEVALAAVGRTGFALEYVSEELKCDADVVMAAVRTNGEALEHAAEEMKNNKEIVLIAVKRSNGFALQLASQSMKLDHEVVLAAIAENALVLEHASMELRSDREVVLVAARRNGLVLEHASAELCNDMEVVKAAITQNPLSLKFASAEIRGNRSLILEAVKLDGSCLEYASDELKRDRSVVFQAVAISGMLALEFADKEIAFDEDLVAESLKHKTQEMQKLQTSTTLPSWSPRPENYVDCDSSIVTL